MDAATSAGNVVSLPVIEGSRPSRPASVAEPSTRRGRPSPCKPCPLRAEIYESRQQAGYWKELHERMGGKREELQEEIQQLQARIKDLERQLFGRKSEKNRSGKSDSARAKGSKKKRGQQPDNPGPPRRDTSNLPVQDEILGLSESQCQCPLCGMPFEEKKSLGSEDSELIEIDVKAHKRRIRRKRYQPGCQCPLPRLITTPGPPKLIPKGRYGISVWVTILLDKYFLLRPSQRLLEDFRTYGIDLSPGTLTGGLKKITPFFEPIQDEIIRKNLEESQWHADETTWPVFLQAEDLAELLSSAQGQRSGPTEAQYSKSRWKLWVFQSCSAVVFRLDPTREARVPESYFKDVDSGVLIVDRYIAYKVIVPVKKGRILLAFCWAHVRRDFLGVAKGWPEHEEWGLSWIEAIGELYHLNKLRLKAGPEQFTDRDQASRAAVEKMVQKREEELSQSKLHPVRRKVLTSLENHWPGLTLFVDRPEIPMDNNQGERSQRKPVCGRKQFYGSRAWWSGQLAAMLFSLFATLALAGLNPRTWLSAYLEACARAGGQAPDDAARFLPWNLCEQERARFKAPVQDSS